MVPALSLLRYSRPPFILHSIHSCRRRSEPERREARNPTVREEWSGGSEDAVHLASFLPSFISLPASYSLPLRLSRHSLPRSDETGDGGE